MTMLLNNPDPDIPDLKLLYYHNKSHAVNNNISQTERTRLYFPVFEQGTISPASDHCVHYRHSRGVFL